MMDNSFVLSSFHAMRGFNSIMCQMTRILEKRKAELTDTILKPVYFLHFCFNSWSVLILLDSRPQAGWRLASHTQKTLKHDSGCWYRYEILND